MFFLRPGHCMRCESRFETGSTLVLVNEKVGQVHFDLPSARIGHVRWTRTTVPVCETCTTELEGRHNDVEKTCEGRSLRMLVSRYEKRATCTTVCWQRARRTRRQRERPPLQCEVCSTFFFPKRCADTKYCSSSCRQLAYRQRLG
jgi:hypothetical protein